MSAAVPSTGMGCMAMLAATAFAALLLTIGMTPPGWAAGMYLPVFLVTGFIVTILGAPLYVLALHYGRANIWTAMGAGFVTGAFFPAFSALNAPSLEAVRAMAAFGALGVTGGLAFFLLATAPISPRRNAAAIVVLVVLSVAAACWLRPPPA